MQNVTCVELRIPVKAIDEETFAQLKAAFMALGGSEESNVLTGEAAHVAWFEVSNNQQEQYLRLKTAAQVLGINEQDIHIATLNDDWATAWQDHWTAMPIGKSLCVRPSFCEVLPDRGVDVVLDPGQAFGTGTHPTTYLCLEAIEDYCLKQPPQSLLDMGAGSGLLAIAAGKMGAKNIVCIDYDPLSVEACEVNANINDVSLDSILGDTPPSHTFELVVANILFQPLLDMVQPLAASVEKHLILSGILDSQVEALITAYQNQGLTHACTRLKEEWAVVELIR
ncbi:50S ribosomal protein L11 methyltransferase [Ghiorsea bivora]|uniref:50S ribosomal protein L11 methyltransferase n=1 Tax=Ghiorsea bivora TaxID=1485545 RepID=UPI00056E2F40|nr:50S ribosomal protein L11 methyltransferase [Ghiorsea bivora]